MENTPDLPAYDDAVRLLHEAGVPTGAAEVHGIITGVLCAPEGARVAWEGLVLGRDAANPPTALSQLLVALHRSTHARLSGMECDFAPLLPGDEHSLAEQIEGLSDWCRGYLLGLYAGGVNELQAQTGDAGEVIRDITRLSEADLDTSMADEEEARALVEIVEYLRVGVQLVFEELQPPASKH
ncbi:MAG: UPF0149 family protein [Sulfuricaulis sp.]|uniref:UPF0149 family protein n=1 Tax=Sulfuricaulis sp. TaxID=2003553 RepID=UPI0025F4B986|nr:UPF0149 family protein [Sulfuricaulis sp.]MCR4346042.1 UPF0149 family protein [Sulfuricaulis sp.]